MYQAEIDIRRGGRLLGSMRMSLLSSSTNAKLVQWIEFLWRPNAKAGNGGTGEQLGKS